MSFYESEIYTYLLDHYENPKNFGTLDGAEYSHEEGNPACGDLLRIDLNTVDNKVSEIRFTGKGCVISMASASILTEMVKGRDLETIKSMDKNTVLEAIGIELSPMRLKCALLSLKVLKAAVYGLTEWPGLEE